MKNLKIRVNSEAESKEAQELFFELGGKWGGGGCDIKYTNEPYLYLENGSVLHGSLAENFSTEKHKEITLPELRAMAYPMKEYLEPLPNGEYKHHSNANAVGGEWIAIPELSQFAVLNGDDEIAFYDGNGLEKSHFISSAIIWQRDQDEPFLTPECTLNDQCAEIYGTVKAKPDLNFGAAQAIGGVDATLAERQSTYGNFEDVAFVTENIMSILAQVRVNGLNDLPNTHRMALYMIASKMARIVNGDFNHLDSWHDIGGYAKLIEKLIKGE